MRLCHCKLYSENLMEKKDWRVKRVHFHEQQLSYILLMIIAAGKGKVPMGMLKRVVFHGMLFDNTPVLLHPVPSCFIAISFALVYRMILVFSYLTYLSTCCS